MPEADEPPVIGSWNEWTGITASRTTTPFGCPFQLETYRVDVEYRAEVDPNFYDAVPTTLLDHINAGGTGFLATYETERNAWARESVSYADAERCPSGGGGGPHWYTDTEQYRWVIHQTNTSECVLVTSGTLVAPPVPSSDVALGRTVAMTADTFCQSSFGEIVSLALVAEQNAYLQFSLVEGA